MDHIPRPPLPLRGMRAHHGSADDGDQLAKTAAGRTMSPTSGMCVSTAAAIATASHQQQVSPAASTAFTVSSYYKRTSPTLEAELSPNFESTLAHNVDSARIPAPPPRLVALTTPPPASKPPAPPSPLMGHAPFRASIASSMTSSSSRETGEEQVVVSHAGQPRLPANVCVSPAIPTPPRAKHAVEDYTVRPLVWPRPYRGGSPRPLVSPPLLSPPPLSKSMPVAVGIPRYASDSSSFAALVSSFSLGQSSIHSFFSRRKSGNASLSSSTQNVNRVTNVHRETKTLADVMALPSSTDEAGSSAGDAGRWSCDHSGYMMKRGGHVHWSWKRRFFVLKNLSLWYFKSDQASAKALGVIVLPSYHVAPDDECDVGCGIYAFIATHSDARTYHFRTDTLSEMQTWMAVLAKACLATDVPATPAATAPTPIFAFGPEPGFRSQDSSTFCHGTHTDVGVKSPPIPEKPALLRGNSMHGKPIAHAMNIPMAERAPPCERLTEPAVATENTDNLSASFTKRLELLELKSRLGNTRSRAEPVAADLTAIPIPPPNVAPLKLPTAIPVVEPSSSSESEESNDSDIGGEYRGASWRRYSGRRDGISLGSSGRAVETYVAASYPEAVIHAPDDYIAWMNDVLFSGDFIVALDGINIPISPPPRQLQSITILFSDITDGVPLIEFLLRLAAKRVVEEALMFYAAVARGERASSESGSWMEQPRSPRTPFTRAIDIRYRPTCPESDAIGGALARLFKHYRDLYIPRPMYRVQMLENINVVWLIMRDEMRPAPLYNSWERWSSTAVATSTSATGRHKLPLVRSFETVARLNRADVRQINIYSGNVDKVLRMFAEIDRIFPMTGHHHNEAHT